MNKKLDLIMNYTSIEQSKKLLELGLNPKSADMHYLSTVPRVGKPYGTHIPCWSAGALLELMPYIDTYSPSIGKFDNSYYCNYLNEDGENMWGFTSESSPTNACYDMVCWLLENNYIIKEEQLCYIQVNYTEELVRYCESMATWK